jgi:hypothetical protein
MHGLAAAEDLTPSRIDLEVVESQDDVVHWGRVRPTKDGPDTRYDLARGERFGNVVVRAELESDDPIGLVTARREHDHRGCMIGPDTAEHLEPVESRKHQVEQHEVGAVILEDRERGLAVLGAEHAEPVLLEITAEHLADDRFVVRDQDERLGHVSILNERCCRFLTAIGVESTST